MPKVQTLTKLFSAIASSDWNAAKTIAEEIAKDEERIGHQGAARLLRGALNQNGKNRTSMIDLNSLEPTNIGIMSSLQPQKTTVSIEDLVHTDKIQNSLASIKKEWSFRERLKGLPLAQKNKASIPWPAWMRKKYHSKSTWKRPIPSNICATFRLNYSFISW